MAYTQHVLKSPLERREQLSRLSAWTDLRQRNSKVCFKSLLKQP